MSEKQQDVISVLEHDHREVEEMFAQIEALPARQRLISPRGSDRAGPCRRPQTQ